MKDIKQEDLLRKLSGQKRLEQAFLLSDFVRQLAILNIKKEAAKKLTQKQFFNKLKTRLHG